MALTSPGPIRDDLARLAHQGLGVAEFARRASRVLARAVPFDGSCVLTMDPATQLPTGEVVQNGLPAAAMARMAGIELGGQDVNTFDALARSGRRAASLSAATGGDLNRSRRHRELRGPHGFGDELRAALVSDRVTWGALTLLRAQDRVDFAPADTALVAAVAGHLAEGLRRALLLDHAYSTRAPDAAVGLVALAADDTVTSADTGAETWLAQLGGTGDGPLPVVVTAVAGRARAIAAERAAAGPIARARARTLDGRWLVLHASTVGDGPGAATVVIIEPARGADLAPLVADAYGLTERERAVTQLVARGLATAGIGARLHLSPWTVQDHLKSIFEKVGASSRGELVARLYFAHDPPRLTDVPADAAEPVRE